MSVTIDKARDVLVGQDITSFKMNVANLRLTQKVIFDTFQNYAKATGIPVDTFSLIKDGCTMIRGSTYIILTDEHTAANRKNWTLAHEVGHVVLGHIKDESCEERQANGFASELLLPELVVLELQRKLQRPLCEDELSRLFGVSKSAAGVRLRQIGRKSRFSPYLKNEIIVKYSRLIDKYIKKENLCLTM